MNQLTLFNLPQQVIKTVSDPYWDEIVKETAPQDDDDQAWNPEDFGEVPHKAEGDQLTIFYDDSHEPPDPDDYLNIQDYDQAWRNWKILVGAQVNTDTLKLAPQHDTHWIEKYWVERSQNKYWYYRYCWMLGRKKNRIYIGSVHSPKAQAKKAVVENAIADGQTPQEIKLLLRGEYK